MFEQTFKNLDDVLREEAGCSSELDYIEQSSWLLFLKYLDDLEQEYEAEATLVGLGKVCLTKYDTAINQDLRVIIPKDLNELSVNYLY